MHLIMLLSKPLGTSFFRYVLNQVNSAGFNRMTVFTNFQPKGWWNDCEIYDIARFHNIDVRDTYKRESSMDQLRKVITESENPRIIAIQFPWIIPQEILSIKEARFLNLHMADISKYRGWYGFSHAILNEDTSYCWNLHIMTSEIDRGAVIRSGVVEISPHETALSLYQKTSESVERDFDGIFMDWTLNSKMSIQSESEGPTQPPQIYDRTSLDSYRLVSGEMDSDVLERISRALFFPPHPSPRIRQHGQLVPFLPDVKIGCRCVACIGINLYRSNIEFDRRS